MPNQERASNDTNAADRGIIVTAADIAAERAAGQAWLETTAYVGEVPLGPDGLAIVTPDPDDPDDDYGVDDELTDGSED